MVRSFFIASLGIALALCALTAPADAVYRTWVSGVGDDGNPCSRIAPCATFSAALNQTDSGGEIDALDPGDFGAVTINKSVIIDGGGGQNATIGITSGVAITVSAGSSDKVILRNIRFNGMLDAITGILFSSGASLTVENCTIFNFTQWGIDFRPATRATLNVFNTTVDNNGQAGQNFGGGIVAGSSSTLGPNRVTIQNTRITRSQGNGSQGALVVGQNTIALVQNSVISNNPGGAIKVNGAGSTVSGTTIVIVEATNISNNQIFAIQSINSATVRVALSGIDVTTNGTALQTSGGGTIVSFGNNWLNGNTTDGSFSSTTPSK